MNAKLAKAVDSTKTFVRTHQTAIAVVATVIVAAKVSRIAVAQRENFLEEKGLLAEFNARYEED